MCKGTSDMNEMHDNGRLNDETVALLQRMHEQFRLTDQHVALLQRMYVEFEDHSYNGAPMVNIKRPYGNSSVDTDIAEILGYGNYIEAINNDDITNETESMFQYLMQLHRETGKALQIVLSTKSFEPGLYGRPEKYNTQKWIRIDD